MAFTPRFVCKQNKTKQMDSKTWQEKNVNFSSEFLARNKWNCIRIKQYGVVLDYGVCISRNQSWLKPKKIVKTDN